MSLIESGFHPLSTVEGQEIPKIAVNLGLPPYINTDKIGVNIHRIHSMMRVGGLSNLQVVGTSGETSSYTPKVVGHSPDGSAYAATTGTTVIVPTYATSRELSDGSQMSRPLAMRWVDASVKINIDEIQDRISRRGEPLRSERAWGREVDKALRKGVSEIGVQHLIFGSTVKERIYIGTATTTGSGLGAGPATTIEALTPVGSTIFGILLINGIHNIGGRLGYREEIKNSEGFRWSAFTGPQVDRAGILKGMSRTRSLVKALPSKNSYKPTSSTI